MNIGRYLSFIPPQYQILTAVICGIAILVAYVLIFTQRTSQKFSHDQPMLWNVALFVCHTAKFVWAFYPDVAPIITIIPDYYWFHFVIRDSCFILRSIFLNMAALAAA